MMLTFFVVWILLAILLGPIVGSILKKVSPLDEDSTND